MSIPSDKVYFNSLFSIPILKFLGKPLSNPTMTFSLTIVYYL